MSTPNPSILPGKDELDLEYEKYKSQFDGGDYTEEDMQEMFMEYIDTLRQDI